MAHAKFVKAAAKDYPEHGIKKGESYYWWKFRFGGKHYSKTPPKRSQLTQSDFLSQIYEIEDDIAIFECNNPEDLRSALDDFASRISGLGEECSDRLSNMPESLQQGSTGELLQNRADECELWASEVEAIDVPDFENTESPTDDEKAELESALEQLKSTSYGGD